MRMVRTDCLNVFMCIGLRKVFSTAQTHNQKKTKKTRSNKNNKDIKAGINEVKIA